MKLSFAMFSLNNFQLSWGDWAERSKAKACLILSEKSFVVHKRLSFEKYVKYVTLGWDLAIARYQPRPCGQQGGLCPHLFLEKYGISIFFENIFGQFYFWKYFWQKYFFPQYFWQHFFGENIFSKNIFAKNIVEKNIFEKNISAQNIFKGKINKNIFPQKGGGDAPLQPAGPRLISSDSEISA